MIIPAVGAGGGREANLASGDRRWREDEGARAEAMA